MDRVRPDRPSHLLRRHGGHRHHRSRPLRRHQRSALRRPGRGHVEHRRADPGLEPGSRPGGAARAVAAGPRRPARRRHHARRGHTGGLVRAVHGSTVVPHRPAHGDLGPRPGRRRRSRCRARRDRPAPPHRPARRHHPEVVLPEPRPRGTRQLGGGDAHRSVRRDVDVERRRHRRFGPRPGRGLLPRGHPAPSHRRHHADHRRPPGPGLDGEGPGVRRRPHRRAAVPTPERHLSHRRHD